MVGFSQFKHGIDLRDLADGDDHEIPPHCGRCATALDNERDLCSKCEWETGEGRQESA